MIDLGRIAFGVRSKFSWGRRYAERGRGIPLQVPERWSGLSSRYGLDRLAEKLDERSFLLNLAKIEQLETLASSIALHLPARPVRVLDIGSQSFVYAPALSLFFSHWQTQHPRTAEVSGIEVDPYRRLWSLHTRRDLARYYASLAPWTEYRVGDFLEESFPQRFDAITWFRPHMAVEPLLAAGLPRRFHRPAEQLRKVFDLLEPQGNLFVSYQSQAEAEMGAEWMSQMGCAPKPPIVWQPPEGAVEKRPQWLQIQGKA